MKLYKSVSALFVTCVAASFALAAFADEGRVVLPTTTDAPVRLFLEDTVRVDNPAAYLQVFVGAPDGCCANKTPVAGRYRVDGEKIVFEPAFDFVAGQDYTVRSGDAATGQLMLTPLMIAPDGDRVLPQVIGVYPSGPDIPENTLRFYIHFSTPMSPHLSTENISLVDENGTVDTAAFMTFKQELWNNDFTRLTLLMDPGRIKRGVAQNLALGPALVAGNRYSIVIASGWPNAQDDNLASVFIHTFEVSEALRSIPEIAHWDIQSPRRATRDPMVIDFDRAFDAALVREAITVLDEAGQAVAGTVSTEDHQRTWRFEPQSDWNVTSVRLLVDARLEDVAGNNFRELLDHSVDTDVRDLDQTSVVLELRPPPD